MNSEEFISVLKQVVRNAAIGDSVKMLESPPGRKPSPLNRDKAAWYATLSPENRKLLESTIESAVDATMFGFLCVLDGVRVVENTPEKGAFELRFVKGESVLLNDPDQVMLHELYSVP